MRLVLGLLFAITLTDDHVKELALRIQQLAAKEAAWPRVDTELRAAELLLHAAPSLSAQFRDRALRLLRQHPKLSLTATMAASLSTLNALQEFSSRPRVANPAVARTNTDAAKFLEEVEHGAENPDDYAWLSAIRRQLDLTVGSDNASVRARDALSELAALVDTSFDFALPALDGKTIHLQDQRGKAVVLNFWATWCQPCRDEMPAFERLYRSNNKDAVILAITDEAPEIARDFIRKGGYTFTVLIDADRRVFDHYLVGGMPSTILLYKTCRVRAQTRQISEPEVIRLLQIATTP